MDASECAAPPGGAALGGPATGESGTKVRLGVLGPLTLIRDGRESPALPPGQRTVLALLALADGSAVRLDEFIDALWGEKHPVSAVGIVQTYMSRLRRVLGPAGANRGAGRLTRDSAGYRINVTEDELDLLAFRRLVREARAFCAAWEISRGCNVYEQALSLWRGEPLANIDVLGNHPAVIALADERAAVVLEYADVAMACDRQGHALPQLRSLAASNPLDEASHSRLMITLASAGRQAEALKLYEMLQRRLDAELGVLPGPALRDAHARILRRQIGHGAAPLEAESRWLPLFQLPAAPADFTGRAVESARLSDAIVPRTGQSAVPLVVITGPPGVGKFALALHVAHKVSTRFPDGQLWAHLAGTSPTPPQAGEVLGEVLRSAGIRDREIPEGLAERAAYYRSWLAGRRILVVANDAAAVSQVLPLLPGTSGCALLVTSRSRLDGLDGAYLLPLDVMTRQDADGFLNRMLGSERIAAEPAAASFLIEACGALPLGLRIAGSKLAARPTWPLSLMTRRLTGARARMAELESGNMSVRVSIGSSYSSLSEPARRSFRLLAAHDSTDFAGWVIAALTREPDAARAIDELESRSLLTSTGTDATGEPRYRLHGLLRDFASECLARCAAEAEEARERLLGAWLQLAMLASARLPAGPCLLPPVSGELPRVVPGDIAGRLTADAVAWFDAERASLLSAVEQACRAGCLGLARRLAAYQCAYYLLRHRRVEMKRLWRIVRDYSGALPPGRSGDLPGDVTGGLRGRKPPPAVPSTPLRTGR